MRVLAARIGDHPGLGDVLELLIDREPTLEELRFVKRRVPGSGTAGLLYVAELEGYVRFFLGDPDRPGRGYDGARFTLRLADGSTETLIGPFSSRPDVVNRVFPEMTVHHVRITESRYFYERAPGPLPTSAAITDRLAAEIAQRFRPTRRIGRRLP
jgi:hypothetical protein